MLSQKYMFFHCAHRMKVLPKLEFKDISWLKSIIKNFFYSKISKLKGFLNSSSPGTENNCYRVLLRTKVYVFFPISSTLAVLHECKALLNRPHVGFKKSFPFIIAKNFLTLLQLIRALLRFEEVSRLRVL
jgi:hypothetical protein